MTIWLSHDTKLRLEDLAAVWRVTPSALIEQALAQFQLGSPPRFGNDTATLQLDEAIEMVLARVLPDQVHAILHTLQPALDPTTPVTATNGNVTETSYPEIPLEPPPPHEYEADPAHSSVTEGTAPPSRSRARKLTPSQIRALRDKHLRGVPVPALMDEYGISRASVFRYLQSDKRAGGAGGP
jgi:hypothetical protein